MGKKNKKTSSHSKRGTRRVLRAVKLFCFCASVFFTVGFGFPRGVQRVASYFNVKQFVVTGNRYISSEMIREKVEFSAGQNIFAVDMDRLEQAVKNIPNIEHVIVRKMFPDIIGIRVVERYPIAILEGEYPVLIDARGTVLKYDLSSERVDMPVLTGIRTGSEEKIPAERMAKALAVLNIIREQGFPVKISEINLSDLNNVVMYPDDMPISILLGADRWEERLSKFSFAWNQIKTGMKPFAKLDLRFQRQIVYKPAELKGFITARN